ncbi:S1 family peptidase [Streptomyces sp. XM4193]|uniref:S1 family peptidase n=1 Tax=Streptomyces sp. XM4193 TaxID=2929782 RepID=UPI001FF70CC7|nr:S1 family peptidase [Streptomyces sp. XM4193]MCK1794568.1 S1 family peptidase [Streptomyces sp. XM4193]
MRRRRVVRVGLSALLLFGGIAATGPATAAMAAPTNNLEYSPGLIEAMSTDLGLSAKEARARLALEATAAEVAPTAEKAAGSAYAGSWYDEETGKLTVALTDGDRAEAVRGTGAETVSAKYSARTLDRAMADIDALAAEKNAPSQVAGWGVDTRANEVVVSLVKGAKKDAATKDFIKRAKAAGPVTVRADATEAPSTFAAGTVGGDPYYTGNVRCSIGFSVHGGFVTAGHCGPQGQQVRGWDHSQIGHFQGSSFPGDDLAWVNVGSGWWTEPVVLGYGTIPDQLVRGSNVAPVGSSICRSGSTTGWHCGTVLAHNETINYEQGAVHQMTGTSVCAQGGDSGGSFLAGDQAQGVTSGGYGDCSAGGRTWYQPVNEILSRYGLTLHTA